MAIPHLINSTYRKTSRGGKNERVYKPGSVLLQATTIHLGWALLHTSSDLPENPCEPQGGGQASHVFLFGLAPNGVYHATNCYQLRGALLPHPFTLTCSRKRVIGGLLSAALSVGFHRPAVSWHSALWCPDFPRELLRAVVRLTQARILLHLTRKVLKIYGSCDFKDFAKRFRKRYGTR